MVITAHVPYREVKKIAFACNPESYSNTVGAAAGRVYITQKPRFREAFLLALDINKKLNYFNAKEHKASRPYMPPRINPPKSIKRVITLAKGK